jgi:hypothetical protein
MNVRDEITRPYLAAPNIPPARLDILRRAFDATVKDTDFLWALIRLCGPTSELPNAICPKPRMSPKRGPVGTGTRRLLYAASTRFSSRLYQ